MIAGVLRRVIRVENDWKKLSTREQDRHMLELWLVMENPNRLSDYEKRLSVGTDQNQYNASKLEYEVDNLE